MSRTNDAIYVGGFAGSSQLDPADSLAGEIGEDPLDAGYSPPDYEPHTAHDLSTAAEISRGESLEQRLAEEEPDVTVNDLDVVDEDPRAGRLVGTGTAGDDVGYAGWASSAEEAAVHVISDADELST